MKMAKSSRKQKEQNLVKANLGELNQNRKDHLKQILILSKASLFKWDFKKTILQGFMFMDLFQLTWI